MLRRISLAILVALASCALAQKAPPKEQIWQGALDVNGAKLTIVLHLVTDAKGKLKGAMDVPEQGAKGIPCTSVSLDAKTLRFAIQAIGATYEGKLSSGGKTATGKFKQAGAVLDLVLKQTTKVVPPTPPKRPQTPQKPYPYNEVEVSYANPAARITLGGSLTFPKAGGPFPAVILITGSGQQDRDETLLGHKPFLVLADYLTRLGIAVLRADDRGIGKSTGNFAASTSQDFATDVKAGIEFLKKRPEIDAKRIGLVGHSEGGLIGPMVAAEDPDVALVVMMAGPGVPGREIIAKQSELIAVANGTPPREAAAQAAVTSAAFDALRTEKDDAKAKAAMVKAVRAAIAKLPADLRAKNKQTDAQMGLALGQLAKPWMRFFAFYDPRTALRKLRTPVLAVSGSLDLQVPPSQSRAEIEKALKEAGNTSFSVVVLPGLNHLFQACKTGSPTEYAKIEETIDPVALKTIGDWIVKVTTP